MRERRGRLGRTVGAVADSIASAARRGGPRPGEPRVVVYDRGGHATLLRPGTPEHEQIVDVAERMIALWREPGGGQGSGAEGGAGGSEGGDSGSESGPRGGSTSSESGPGDRPSGGEDAAG